MQHEWGRSGIHIGYSWGKPEGNRPLGTPSYRRVNNVRTDLGEIGWGGMNCIGTSEGLL
jgi:hypothetical protein